MPNTRKGCAAARHPDSSDQRGITFYESYDLCDARVAGFQQSIKLPCYVRKGRKVQVLGSDYACQALQEGHVAWGHWFVTHAVERLEYLFANRPHVQAARRQTGLPTGGRWTMGDGLIRCPRRCLLLELFLVRGIYCGAQSISTRNRGVRFRS